MQSGVPTPWVRAEGNTACSGMRELHADPARSKNLVHAWSLRAREPGDLMAACLGDGRAGRSGKAEAVRLRCTGRGSRRPVSASIASTGSLVHQAVPGSVLFCDPGGAEPGRGLRGARLGCVGDDAACRLCGGDACVVGRAAGAGCVWARRPTSAPLDLEADPVDRGRDGAADPVVAVEEHAGDHDRPSCPRQLTGAYLDELGVGDDHRGVGIGDDRRRLVQWPA